MKRGHFWLAEDATLFLIQLPLQVEHPQFFGDLWVGVGHCFQVCDHLGPFITVPQAVVTSRHKLFSVLLHNCDLLSYECKGNI